MKEIEKLKSEIEMLKSIINAIDDHLNDTRLSNRITKIENAYHKANELNKS